VLYLVADWLSSPQSANREIARAPYTIEADGGILVSAQVFCSLLLMPEFAEHKALDINY
jgi:hypothetical protein